MTPVNRSYSTTMFISIRFLMGFTQCIVCIFLPLWTMENAPKTKRTIWMSYLQASVPFGVMAGYIVASITMTTFATSRNDPDYHGSDSCFGLMCWRWPFLVEIFLLLPLFILLQFVPKAHIAVPLNKSHRPSKLPISTNLGRVKDIERPHCAELQSDEHSANELSEETVSSNGKKKRNGDWKTANPIDQEGVDDRKYDDVFIQMKTTWVMEQKQQLARLRRHSMVLLFGPFVAFIAISLRLIHRVLPCTTPWPA